MTSAIDGSDDEDIHCFNENQPCHAGLAILAEPSTLSNEQEETLFHLDDITEAVPHDFSQFSTGNLLNDFENLDLAFLDDIYLSVNTKLNRLLSILDELVEALSPLKKLTKREVKFKNKPWINSKLQKMMCIRDSDLFRRLKKNGNNQAVKDLYKTFMNRVSNSLRGNKASYFYS